MNITDIKAGSTYFINHLYPAEASRGLAFTVTDVLDPAYFTAYPVRGLVKDGPDPTSPWLMTPDELSHNKE